MKSLNVMIVDDSAITAGKIAKMLEEFGHSVVRICSTGKCAVDAYCEVLPDVVTMDISMPEMNGIEATRAIVAKNPNATIIVVTTQGQEQMVIEAIDAGARGYLLKPVKQESLLDMISKVYGKYGGSNNLG